MADRADNLVGNAASAERPVVSSAVIKPFGRNRHHRIGFLQINPDKRISFIIFQQNVIVRFMALDERVLKNQCFKFAVCDNHIEVSYFFNHSSNLREMFSVKIAADTVFQFFRFADVNHVRFTVEHDIDAGKQRQIIGLCPKRFQFRIQESPSASGIAFFLFFILTFPYKKSVPLSTPFYPM